MVGSIWGVEAVPQVESVAVSTEAAGCNECWAVTLVLVEV
jgi:hypothetical protein